MEHVKQRRKSRRGLATVEAALVFPLLLVLTFGVIEYGWMFLKQQQITNAARQGAPLGATPLATKAQVDARVAEVMTAAGLGTSGYTTTVTPATLSTLTPGQTLSVQVSVTYANITITDMSILPAPATLSGKIVMAREGP